MRVYLTGIRIVVIGVVFVIGIVAGTMALDITNAKANNNQSPVQVPSLPENENGQTYGSAANDISPKPDLIKAIGVDGTLGYVLKKDMDGKMPKSPTEALEQQRKAPKSRTIPLYDVDGKTVIGEFKISKGGGTSIKY